MIKKLNKKAIMVKYLIEIIVGVIILFIIAFIIYRSQVESTSIINTIKDLF